MLLHLVDRRHVHALAVKGARLGGHRAQHRAGERIEDVVGADLEPRGELRRGLRHLHGVGEADPRLVPRDGRAVNLRARLIVGHEAVEHQAGGEGAFGVALPHLHERRAEPPEPV